MTTPSLALARLLPRRADYDGLSASWRGDVVAGLTVGVVALPLALAFGITSGLGAEQGEAFLAALADASDMRASAEHDVAAIKAGDLRKAQARLDGEEQQHMIAAAEPACSIGRGEDRVDLRAR